VASVLATNSATRGPEQYRLLVFETWEYTSSEGEGCDHGFAKHRSLHLRQASAEDD
jgi:hypothetical protein